MCGFKLKLSPFPMVPIDMGISQISFHQYQYAGLRPISEMRLVSEMRILSQS